eukprot:TRINITY_DN26267_c0_g1_i1.p2 TRINITY_DN26267_c0_g1~~TRINITY_DN26267_c0_g1_i1.p2  ORF type:complete len:114 (+),score=20.64 TRINITY_DN26267_c0_g1_i1:128-469(+)
MVMQQQRVAEAHILIRGHLLGLPTTTMMLRQRVLRAAVRVSWLSCVVAAWRTALSMGTTTTLTTTTTTMGGAGSTATTTGRPGWATTALATTGTGTGTGTMAITGAGRSAPSG